ncbi:restriction endonuclease subunit S [Paracoccus versutus]|uniref:restriction endonuclease subunit S n=1 Tax=Paracoccus versutus TaxID=34007 RepID=UPI000DF82369|nr:restriction endonuclease subunit S [Paracoccus versutus]RDD72753.1 restriction endonuclease subunit S [Paracoccus versutus]
MKPYPAYKESGVEWLGMVPEGWETRRFKTFLREREERSTTGAEVLLSVSAYAGVTPRAEGLDAGEFLSRAESLEGYKVCHVGDLVMNIMLAWNRAQGITQYGGIVSPAYAVFSCDKAVDRGFLNYLVRSDNYCLYFKAFSAGVIDSRLRLYPEQFVALSCIFPPLPEQQAIAAFLDRETAKIDGLIEEQRRLIALLAEKRQATISHAVTRGMNPDASLKPSGVEWLGDIPEGWEVVRASRVLRVQSGFAFPSEGFSNDPADTPLLRGVNISPDGLRWDETVFWPREGNDRLKPFELKVGDVVIGMDRPWIASGLRIAQVGEEDIPSLLLQRVGRFQVGSEANPKFILHQYADDRFMHFLAPDLTGVSVPHISPSQIESFHIVLPPRNEQDEIVGYLHDVLIKLDTLTETATTAITLLQERRAALISAAVTGKIDVREVAKAPAKTLQSLRVSAMVAGVIIARHGQHLGFGRMMVQKFLFMTQACANAPEIGGNYERQAAGPLDRILQNRVEADLEAAGLVRVRQEGGPGSRVQYEFLGDAAALRAELASVLGDRMEGFDYLSNQLGGLTKNGIEAVATLYAAWNDFLIDGRTPDRADIIREVLENWHPEKSRKFTEDDLGTWLEWMERQNIVPDGTGPQTQTGRLFT